MKSRRVAVWVVAALAAAAWGNRRAGAAVDAEAYRASAEHALTSAAARLPSMRLENRPLPRPAPAPVAPPERKLFEQPAFAPVSPSALGPQLGSFVLANRLDGHRGLVNRQLGAKTWDLSMASDAAFDVQYLSLRRPETLNFQRVENLDRVRGEGIVVAIDPSTKYRVKVSISIFNPVRGSTLKLTPEPGTNGPSHSWKTGQVLDLVKGASYVFKAGSREFWVLYGTDIDPATNRPSATRSLLFIHEAGLDSKAYPVSDGRLVADVPLGVALGETQLTLLKTAAGELRIHAR